MKNPTAGLQYLSNDLSLDSKDFSLAWRLVAFLILACCCVFFDIEHLLFTAFGAVMYAMVQFRMPDRNRVPRQKKIDDPWGTMRTGPKENQRPPNLGHSSLRAKAKSKASSTVSKPSKPTGAREVMPLSAPTFQSQGWDNEVMELLARLKPTESGTQAVNQIVTEARKVVLSLFPEAQLLVCAVGDPTERAAFGVAVPEVELVIKCPAQTIFRRLQTRLSRQGIGGPDGEKISYYKLRKSAVRACTDMLVTAGFKFRRSAFRGLDPKVTLLAPPEVCRIESSIPVDLSVNNETPLRNSALVTAVAALDSRAVELALLVKRWAKDRGVCHGNKGMLTTYGWNILTFFFLQTRGKDTIELLPPLRDFDWSSCPHGVKPPPGADHQPEERRPPDEHSEWNIPGLLTEFFHFYWSTVDWETEAVSLHWGQRGPLPKGLEVHEVLEGEDEGPVPHPEVNFDPRQKVLTIMDPWEPQYNLAAQVTFNGICHMKEELRRACELRKQDASLSQLLEPWIPPDAPPAACP